MIADGKALLTRCQALPECHHANDHSRMNAYAAIRLRDKFNEAFPKNGNISFKAIAEACHVTKQAVTGWTKDGRISKSHLPILAKLSGKPLHWWLDAEETPVDEIVAIWPDLIRDQRHEILMRARTFQANNILVKRHVLGDDHDPVHNNGAQQKKPGQPRKKA